MSAPENKPTPYEYIPPESKTESTTASTTDVSNPAAVAASTPRAVRRRRNFVTVLGIIALAVAGLLTLIALVAVGIYIYYSFKLPPVEQLGSVQLTQSTKILDRNGGLLFEVFDPQGGKRTVVKPEQIPEVLKQATISTEDPSFYSNLGIDPKGVARAIYYDVRYHEARVGGSTITQQLAKNLYLTPEASVERKIREAMIALEMTRRYPKEQILAAYLNTVYYGNLAYGVQAAAQAYFNKDVSQLNLAEASLLAGLPQAPAVYDPCDNEDAALNRQKRVLKLMVNAKYINETQANEALQEMTQRFKSPDFDKQCSKDLKVDLKAPHFVNYVRAQLEKAFGTEVMYKGGLQVTTTLDPTIQTIVEDEARKQIAALRARNVNNAAAVVMQPQSGEILAMLGSVDFFNKEISGQVNVADRARQPGSSIKPINYITAFKNGWTPATPIYDLKTSFPQGNGQPPYVPVDYDNKEHGLVPVRVALASSLNIPAVKTLYSISTIDENKYPEPLSMIDTASDLGISTFTDAQGNPKQTYGLALTLGGGEVKLIELTDAYIAFANLGARVPPAPFLKIVDGNGQTIFDARGKDKASPVCAQFDASVQNEEPDGNGNCPKSAPYAYLITSILSDDNARSIGFGKNSVLQLSRPAAVKTGTTNDFKDNWTIGYTPDLVVGVWVGNANNAPMQNVSGVTGAAPIWHNIMERALKDIPPRDFPVPPSIVHATICADSGFLATDLCPADHRRDEIFAGHAPTEKDTVWQRMQCGQSSGAVVQVPPNDVDNLIPYDQILAWAARSGWHVAPNGSVACNGGSGGKVGGSAPPPGPAVNPGPLNKPRGKGEGGKGHGKGKGGH